MVPQLTKQVIEMAIKVSELNLKKDSLATIEDVNRLRPNEVLVFMTGILVKLNLKIALLATKNNDDKIVFIKDKGFIIFLFFQLK